MGDDDDDDEKPANKQRTGKAPPSGAEARKALGEAKRKRKMYDRMKAELKAINAKARAKKQEMQAIEQDMQKVESVAGRMGRAIEKIKKQKAFAAKKRAKKSWDNAKTRVSRLKEQLDNAKDKVKQGDGMKQKALKKVTDLEKHYKQLKKQDYHLSHEGFETERALKNAKAEYAKVKNQVDNVGDIEDIEERYRLAKEKFEELKAKRAAAKDQGEGKGKSKAQGKSKVMKRAKAMKKGK